MGPQHRLFGGLCGAAFASMQGWSFGIIAASAIIATSSAHGWSSPDMDQTKPWIALNRLTPPFLDPLLAHRRLSHWWGLPALAYWGITQMPAENAWPFLALLVGWLSHLLGDLVFGKGGGIPVMPWGGLFVGLPLRTGKFAETGKAHIFGRERTIIPFGPVRLLSAGGMIYLLAVPWTA